MGGEANPLSKIYLELAGATVLALTIRSIVQSQTCKGILVLIREQDRELATKIASAEIGDLELLVVVGGSTRQESVHCGLKALEGKTDFALIHDGARPFCPVSCIQAVAAKGRESGAAILGYPVKPSLKRLDADGEITESLPRSTIWEAQTPQVFRYDMLRGAHEHAIAQQYQATDDSELMERIDFSVHMVPGDERNIKITTAFDWKIAQMLVGG